MLFPGVIRNANNNNTFCRTVGIVMGIFVLSWMPFFIWMPLTALLELETPAALYSVILWVGYSNSVVNPFIYGLFSREFREVILKDVGKAKRWSKAATEERSAV